MPRFKPYEIDSNIIRPTSFCENRIWLPEWNRSSHRLFSNRLPSLSFTLSLICPPSSSLPIPQLIFHFHSCPDQCEKPIAFPCRACHVSIFNVIEQRWDEPHFDRPKISIRVRKRSSQDCPNIWNTMAQWFQFMNESESTRVMSNIRAGTHRESQV
jgi:hypothetical protein